MTSTLRLCACLYLLAVCSAKPTTNIHQDFIKQNDNTLFQERVEVDRKYNATEEPDELLRPRRQVEANKFFDASISLGGQASFDTHPQLITPDRQNFEPQLNQQQFGPPGLHPISKLGATIQNIMDSHIEAAVQLNKAAHDETLHVLSHLPPPISPCSISNLQTHSLGGSFETSHHIQTFGEASHHSEFGQPQIISSGTLIKQMEISCSDGDIRCQNSQVDSTTKKPSTGTMTDIHEPQPSVITTSTTTTTTTTEQPERGIGKDSDVVYEIYKNSKNLDAENEAGIDIRLGGGNSDMFPSGKVIEIKPIV